MTIAGFPQSRSGSGVSLTQVVPTLDLGTLLTLLADEVERYQSLERPIFRRSGQKVVVDTCGVLKSLFASPAFISSFSLLKGGKGFVRDIWLPQDDVARVGGRLLGTTQEKMKEAVQRVVDALERALDQCLGNNAQALSPLTVQETRQRIARGFPGRLPEMPRYANLVPIAFRGSDRKAVDRSRDIARIFSAIESVEGGYGLEGFLKGVTNCLIQKEGYDETEVAAIANSLRLRAERNGDAINRFLHFLEDEALARVRLQVSMRLMQAIAANTKSEGFRAYVDRVVTCFDLFASPEGNTVLLDVSAHYGQRSNANLSDFLRSAGFYSFLPVWPEWSVQMFEARTNPTAGSPIIREVSYRFRINGKNPENGKSAFENRIELFKERLLEPDGTSDRSHARVIAGLVFLWLVVPEDFAHPQPFDGEKRISEIAERLNADPLQTVKWLIDELHRRSKVVSMVARELVQIISEKSHRVLQATEQTVDRFRVAVSRGVLDIEAFASYSDKSEVLRRSATGLDHVEWLKYLTIGRDTVPPSTLLSFEVRTDLNERSLASVGDPRKIAIAHDLERPVLPVRLVPLSTEQKPRRTDLLDPGSGVEILYCESHLKKKEKEEFKRYEEQFDHEQRRTAALVAFATLTYVALVLLLRKARMLQRNRTPDLSLLLMRLAHGGRSNGAESTHPATVLYAISRALETTLGRACNTKVQGYNIDEKEKQQQFRHYGTLSAVAGGQPLRFTMEGSLDRVAVVSYATRPCDHHPDSSEPPHYLWTFRTYLAERQGEAAYLRVARTRNRVIGSLEAFAEAQPVLTELAWLAKRGYSDVILLSHHFGTRHVGRAAERKSPHATLAFLDRAHERFPEMRFYTVRRDIFPATRLRTRAHSESAFEVATFDDHQKLYEQYVSQLNREVIPFYTLATLHVVPGGEEEEDNRPQSGFCTYFFDVDHRMKDMAWKEARRAELLGVGGDMGVRASIISVLRALHFLESERPIGKQGLFLPVLDPFDWMVPTHQVAAGELVVMEGAKRGKVVLNLSATLSHITEILELLFPNEADYDDGERRIS